MQNTRFLEVKTDYRIELFSLIAFLSKLEGKWIVDRSENPYTKLLIDEFTNFADHQAVVEFPSMWNKGLCWDAIPFLVFHLNDEFSLLDKNNISKRLSARYEGDFRDVVKYLSFVRDFALTTNFLQFYNSNMDNDLISEVNKKVQAFVKVR